MSEIKVEIEYIVKGDNITAIAYPQKNNFSNNNNNGNGGKPFVLGASHLGAGDRLANTYDGFMSGVLTDSIGNADVTIAIRGTNITSFTLYGDSIAQQFATKIVVDGKEWVNNWQEFVWVGAAANSHTIKITRWNTPLYPVRITKIAIGLTTIYDSSALQEVVRGSQSSAENKLPSYGVLSQYGNVTFVDKTKQLLRFADIGLLKPNLKVKVLYNQKQVGEYVSEKWNYTYGNAKIMLNLTDSLIKWNDILFDGVDMCENKTALEIYNYLMALTPNETFVIDDVAKTYLQSIKLKYYNLNKGKLIESWNKLCNLASLNIYKAEDGKIMVKKNE